MNQLISEWTNTAVANVEYSSPQILTVFLQDPS